MSLEHGASEPCLSQGRMLKIDVGIFAIKKKEIKWDTSYNVPSLKKYSKVYVINVFMEVIYAKYLEQCLGLDK